MKLSVCTITFRHQLVSMDEIANWALQNQFDGIELWGIHAINLYEQMAEFYQADWIESMGLKVSMLSHYLPLFDDAKVLQSQMLKLCKLANHWRCNKIRIFAGDRSSITLTESERAQLTARLRWLSEMVEQHGLMLVAETHPGTLADSAESTIRLLDEIDHPAFKLNFDVIHVWEFGADPMQFVRQVSDHIVHFHFKNVSQRDKLSVFAPANVYAAAGSRDGMTPLFEGDYPFAEFIQKIRRGYADEASLEWFGADVYNVLKADRVQVDHCQRNVNRLAIA